MSLPNKSNKKFKEYLEVSGEIGEVVRIQPPIALIRGLPSVYLNEIVYFDNETQGVVTALMNEDVEILLLSKEPVIVGTKVTRSKKLLSIPVGDGLLGQSINPVGDPIYSNVFITNLSEERYLDTQAQGVSSRVRISESFETGVTSVDLMIPLGKGQRELIIGDRKIGKTEFLLQTILNQARAGTIVIYASIGKKRISIKQLEEFVSNVKIKENVVLVSSSASDSLGSIYLTPYSAMTIAEYFRDKGKDVLVIFDDLSTHAKYYREMSLIAKKFPGREAYPGDIFYAHARLLERGGRFKVENANVSITCLPVAETIEGDISGYIQTNLMSITDGHIFFDSDLFKQGRKPAINHFLSVTRVGRQTQSKLCWGVNRELTSFLTLFSKTQNFIHFGAELNEGIKATLTMGEKLINFFNQPIKEVIPLNVQILFFCLVWVGSFPIEENDKVRSLMLKSSHLYTEDKEFKEKVDSIIIHTSDFNTVLGKISAQYTNLISYIEEKNEKK